jgi:hypothetical protein
MLMNEILGKDNFLNDLIISRITKKVSGQIDILQLMIIYIGTLKLIITFLKSIENFLNQIKKNGIQ